MRTFRTLVGVVLVLIGVPALALAVAGWSAQRHAGPAGSFSAQLGSVRSDGYAVTVTDVATVLDRHVAASLLGSDRLRVTVSSATVPVVLWLVPTADLNRYLAGAARTELAAVGFSDGVQPVQLTDVAGTAHPVSLVEQPFWTRVPSGQSLEWDRSTDTRTSLMLARADGLPGFGASLKVTVYPSWLDEATWIAMFTGAATLAAASAVLFWRGRGDRTFGMRHEQVLEFADLVADRLASSDRAAAHGWTVPNLRRDLTGEFVHVPSARHALPEPSGQSPYIDTAT